MLINYSLVIINSSVPLLFPYTVLNKNCNAAAEEIKIAMVQGNVSIGIISNPEYKLDVTAAEAEWEETPVLTISPVVLWGVEFYRKN